MRRHLTSALLAGVCALALGPALAADKDSAANPNSGGMSANPGISRDNAAGAAAGGVTLSGRDGPIQVKPAEKPTLDFSEAQRQAIVEAVMREDSHQPTPKEFKPAMGGQVPPAVNIHGLPRPLVYEIPALKEYMYAHLDHEIVIVDAQAKKVAALIPLPDNRAHSGAKPDEKEAAVKSVGGLADLSEAQKRMIYQSASGEAQPVPDGAAMLAGAEVPSGMSFSPLPPEVAAQAPQVQELQSAKLQDGRLLLVQPRDRKIVGVITQDEGGRLAQDGAGKPDAGANTGVAGAPTRDPMREREESGKDSAYSGPHTIGPAPGTH